MYYVTALIDNRRVFTFSLQNKSKTIPNFIIPKRPGSDYNVLSFLEGINVMSKNGEEEYEDLKYYFGKNKKNKAVTKIHISKEKKGEDKQGDFYFSNDDSAVRLKRKNNNLEGYEKLELEIVFNDKKDKRKAGAIFHFVPESFNYQFIFDFGSESSQIYYKNSEKPRFSKLNIIDELERVSEIPSGNGAVYLQEGDKREYLTKVFFKNNGKLNLHQKPNEYNGEDAIKLLVNLNERKENEKGEKVLVKPMENGFVLPNLKIATLVDILENKLIDFKLENKKSNTERNNSVNLIEANETIYRTVLNMFCHVMLNFLTKHTILEENDIRTFDLFLLVPNVYDQRVVSKIFSNLQEDLAIILERYPDYRPIIKGFEVHVLSESDASFLGIRNTRREVKLKENANILVIDSGKGTTDLSVVQDKLDGYNSYSGIYRNGIVGAGNSITYAFVETIAHLVVGEEDKEMFLKFVLNSPEFARNEFMKLVEKLKHNYNKNIGISLEKIKSELKLEEQYKGKIMKSDTEKWDLNILTAYFKTELLSKKSGQKYSIKDYFGYITGTVNDLVKMTCKAIDQINLKDNRIDHVFLSGRALIFEPFRNTLKNEIQQYLKNNKKEIYFFKDIAKSACVFGPVNEERVNFDSGLISIPKAESKYSGNALPEKLKENKGCFNFSFGKKKTNSSYQQLSQDLDFPVNYSFFKQGARLENLHGVDILINGDRYNLVDGTGVDLKDGGPFTLFFDGDNLSVICESKTMPLRKQANINIKYREFALSSLFPELPVSISEDLPLREPDETITESKIGDLPTLPDYDPVEEDTPEDVVSILGPVDSGIPDINLSYTDPSDSEEPSTEEPNAEEEDKEEDDGYGFD